MGWFIGDLGMEEWIVEGLTMFGVWREYSLIIKVYITGKCSRREAKKL